MGQCFSTVSTFFLTSKATEVTLADSNETANL